jgi:hypothetical protein
MLQQTRYQYFLDQFTEQVILALVAGIREKELERREEERIAKEIEVQKLKQKYLEYSTLLEKAKREEQERKKIEENNQFQKNKIEVKQEIRAVEKELSSNELTPSIMHQQTSIKEGIIQPQLQFAQRKTGKEIPIFNIKMQPQQARQDFGKLFPLIQDKLVTYIESQGQDKNIIIRRAGQTFKTPLILTKDEIISIIKEFSEKTRIPLVEGMLDARYEDLEITAIVSEVLEPSFIIKKDIIPINKPMPTQLQRPMPILPAQQTRKNFL